ncbi:MAG: hypothetical protein KAI79_16410 [Bacteroidales bacterium]|nr:hypothetical protein [Bacteroidales bacterium]
MEIGHFASETIIKDSITVRTDLLSEVDLIIEFIIKHINKAYIITGNPRREERWDYPLDAIREIVINMIVHRDYRSANDSTIKIFDDRIEFFNPGGLIDDLTIEKVMSGNYRSHLRNKQIANIFKEIGLIEKYGSGIKRVIDIFISYGLKKPSFEAIEDGFLVTVYKTAVNDGGVSDGLNDGLNERQQLCLKKIKKVPGIKIKELSKLLNIPIDTLDRYIKMFVKNNLIVRKGSKKTGGYHIVYKAK